MNELRQILKQQRLALTEERRSHASNRISERLFALPIFQQSHTVACYLPHQNEVDTQRIITTLWKQNKPCYLPKVNPDHTLTFIHYTPTTHLIANSFGIFEPEYSENYIIAPENLDLILLPPLAFNAQGTRLGWGLGYYDRTLAFLNKEPRGVTPILIGLAYDFQYQESLEKNTWDVLMNIIITETKTYEIT